MESSKLDFISENGEKNGNHYIVEDNCSDEEEEAPMAMIVEDEEISRKNLEAMLQTLGIRTRYATTVQEAKDLYFELHHDNISIDLLFLDYVLKDNTTGVQFLKLVRQNHWMEKALIIMMYANDDSDMIKECFNYNISNFLRKPITKPHFANESYKIRKHLESLKCPLKGYKIERELGSGSSGVVHLIRHKKTKELFAMRTVQLDPTEKSRLDESDIRFFKNLKVPTILEYREYKIEDSFLYTVQEFAEFGTLNQKIAEKRSRENNFTVEETLDYMTELILGLYSLHEKGLIHRNIKTDNLFICKGNILKIGDLENAKATETGNTLCGTVFYIAPEVFTYQNYDIKIDVWAAGVILYELIMLKKPFDGQNTDVIKEKIKNNSYEPLPNNTDERLKILLKQTLNPDPSQRSTSEDLLKLEFISERIKELFDSQTL
jgi:serine/threonine protein kinase